MSPYEKEAHIQNYRDRLQDETDPKAIAFLTETLKQLTNDNLLLPRLPARVRLVSNQVLNDAGTNLPPIGGL